MAETAMIGIVRAWLRTCPSISTGDRFNVNYLGVTDSEFTIEDIPTTPIIKQYLGGALKQKNFMLASREPYGMDILENIANSGLYDDLSNWVRTQNRLRAFPNLGEGTQVRFIQVTSTGYVFENDADKARYQIPLQITYYDKEN